MYKDILGFVITPHMQRVMDVSGCYASIMRADKKKEDSDSSLPPGMPIPVLPVDYLKVRPEGWVGGEGSYVVPVDPEWALWFNWSMNNTSETAVLPSVKGMNPITGQRINGLDLEEYQDECPIHKIPFSKGRLCKECGYKWPAQNFVSMPNSLHLDGYFCSGDNCVRQFYFTEEMARSIPEQVIGKEDTVPAFGFCFYKLKECQTKYEKGSRLKNEFPVGPCSFNVTSGSSGYLSEVDFESIKGIRWHAGTTHPRGPRKLRKSSKTVGSSIVRSASFSCGMGEERCRSVTPDDTPIAYTAASAAPASLESYVVADSFSVPEERERSVAMYHMSAPDVGVGAGAKIKQGFQKSIKGVDLWNKDPKGVLRLYFVFQSEFEQYAKEGFNDLKGSDLGYLEGLKVGGGS